MLIWQGVVVFQTACRQFDQHALLTASLLRLQTAAGSVVGRCTIAIAKHKGIKTISVVRRREQKQELLDLG